MTTIRFENNAPVAVEAEAPEEDFTEEDPGRAGEIFFKIKEYLRTNNITIGDKLSHEDFVNFINSRL